MGEAKAFRAGARVTFFARAKKVTKESTPFLAPALRAGPRSRREFPDGTSMCLPETARIVRAAPFGGLPASYAAADGVGKRVQPQRQKPPSATVTSGA